MKNKRITALLLALCLVIFALPMGASAAETFTYSISAATTSPSIGSEFDVVISLTNYAEIASEIRGLQIDVTNVDPNVFEVVSHGTAVDDSSAASNKTSHQPNRNNLLRYVYLHLSGSMDKSVTEVMRFRLKVKDDIEEGSITLPIVIKIGTMDKQNITLNDSLTINYSKASSNIVSVDVSWGNMEFTYDDGTWDTETHKRIGAGWKPDSENSNLITVANSGNTDVKMEFKYTPESDNGSLSGSFTDVNGNNIKSAIDLKADGTEQKYWFNISGTTKTRWTDDYITVGTITLTITE